MKIKVKQLFLFCILSLTCAVISGCSRPIQTEGISKSSFKLNTIVSITIYDSTDETLLDNCFSICDKYETLFSRTAKNSELYKLNTRTLTQNTTGKFVLTEETADLIKRGLYYSQLSGGAFDISIAPISALWDFNATSPSVPSLPEIEHVLAYVGYQNIFLEKNEIAFSNPDTSIDLGAIAKGYIADRIKEYLLSQGVNSAIINLGGNVLCIGSKPAKSAFRVGIQKPFANRNETIATMSIKNKSVVSSGIYERFFEKNGELYHHLLNPKTGYPYDNNLISVTIISDESVDGDALSTTCFSLGLEEGLLLAEQLDDVDAIFITSDYKIHYTKDFQKLYDVKEVK